MDASSPACCSRATPTPCTTATGSQPFVADHRLRRSLLRSSLALDNFDRVICETPHDVGVLTDRTSARPLFDCPTPWADELRDEGRLTERQHARLHGLDIRAFDGVDRLAFWWESYTRYAVEHDGIDGHDLMKLDYDCTPSPERTCSTSPTGCRCSCPCGGGTWICCADQSRTTRARSARSSTP